jgi:HEAT repeat protein/beta-lactamase regulating signal transducer with metallopeptidase domain
MMTWLIWLPETAWKGAIILAAAWGTARLLQRQPAALRHLVWSAGLGGVLVLPLLAAVTPFHVPLLSAPAASVASQSADLADRATQPAASDRVPESPAPSAPLAERGLSGGDTSTPVQSVGIRLTTLQWLMIAWLAGVLVLAARMLSGFAAVRRIRHGSHAVDDTLADVMRDAAARVGLRSSPQLVVSDAVTMPCASGWMRPVVMLPTEARQWSRDRLEVVLLHELTHIQRGDYVAHLVAEVARMLHWYNPLVWIAARSLRAEAERATDERVVYSGARPSDYAAHLLDIVRGAGGARVPAPLMPLAHRSEFEGRLLAILEYAGSPLIRARAAALTFLVAAGLTMTVASIGEATPPGADPIAAIDTSNDTDRDADTGRDTDGVLPERYTSGRTAEASNRAAGQEQGSSESISNVAALTSAINDPVPSVRMAVIEALGKTRDSVAVRALMSVLLEDDNAEVRRAAAWSLGQIEDAQAVPALMEALLRDSDPEVRKNSASALGSIGSERAAGALAQALENDDDLQVRIAAADGLGNVDVPLGLTVLTRVLGRETDVSLKVEIIESLDNIDDVRAAPALHGALRDRSPAVREAAAEALSSLDSRTSVEPLMAVARDPDVKVRRAVMNALSNLQSSSAVPTFATALRDDDAEVRAAAADGLSNVDNLRTAPPELVRAMEDANDEVRHRVAHALGHIQDPAGLPALVAHVRDRNVEVRRAVVEALQGFEDESATSALRTALRDADAEVRESAARALGERSRK